MSEASQGDDPPMHAGRAAAAPSAPKPAHYRVLCISLYTKDIVGLDAKVQQLKDRGHTKASRSSLIRAALDQVNLRRVPRGA